MKYKSTNNQSSLISFKEAVLKGLADDNGLFFPTELPVLPETFFKQLEHYSPGEIAFHFLKPYVGNDLTDNELKEILDKALNFELLLHQIDEDIYSMELYHGPTLAFKDVGARIMARLLSKFKQKDKDLTVLVATSGDTGSAVANGFLGVEGIKVVVLYPKGMVSAIQEKQFSTLGQNITALQVNGTFDDCQRMVKEAFADKELNAAMQLSSANSINVARFLPQAVYYFSAYAHLKDKSKPMVISVPSGNYGNLTAGLFAQHSGLPIHHFIASSNSNDVVPEYLQSGKFQPRPSVSTISNAMDVGNPSNFARIAELYQNNWQNIRQNITGYSFTDEQTKSAISEVYQKYKYILDPHGAVAYLGLKKYLNTNKSSGIFLETAHPAKFFEIVEAQLPVKVPIPMNLQNSLKMKNLAISMDANLEELKRFLLK
jgi:threonine synthase